MFWNENFERTVHKLLISIVSILLFILFNTVKDSQRNARVFGSMGADVSDDVSELKVSFQFFISNFIFSFQDFIINTIFYDYTLTSQC